MRTAFRRMLAELSIRTIFLQRDASIIDAIAREKPDLVFVCAKMLADACEPELQPESGSEHRTTIIACAGRHDPGSVLQALSRGADDYLVKPFDRAVLKSKLSCHGLV
jgi:AmiR/NasT family two-component response regulator